ARRLAGPLPFCDVHVSPPSADRRIASAAPTAITWRGSVGAKATDWSSPGSFAGPTSFHVAPPSADRRIVEPTATACCGSGKAIPASVLFVTLLARHVFPPSAVRS